MHNNRIESSWITTARNDGRIEGRAEGAAIEQEKAQIAKHEMVKKMKRKGLAIPDIAEITGISESDIADL